MTESLPQTPYANLLSDNVTAVYDAAGARRQPGEAVSDAFPELPLSRACGGQRPQAAQRKPSLL